MSRYIEDPTDYAGIDLTSKDVFKGHEAVLEKCKEKQNALFIERYNKLSNVQMTKVILFIDNLLLEDIDSLLLEEDNYKKREEKYAESLKTKKAIPLDEIYNTEIVIEIDK